MINIPDDMAEIIKNIIPELEKEKNKKFEQEQLILELPFVENNIVNEEDNLSKIEIQL